uniref:Uncharacterized protein n=2 Tax=Canis lupus familiaris TaxID=9615 RepID=A0A8P0TTJ8_CANLF
MTSSSSRSALGRQCALGCCASELRSKSGLVAAAPGRSASMTPSTASSMDGPRSRWKDSSGSAGAGARRAGGGGCGTAGGGAERGAPAGGARGSGGGPPPCRLRNEVSPKASPPRPTCSVCRKSPSGAEMDRVPRPLPSFSRRFSPAPGTVASAPLGGHGWSRPGQPRPSGHRPLPTSLSIRKFASRV